MKPVIVLIASVSLLLPGCTSPRNKETDGARKDGFVAEPDKELSV